MERYDVKDGGAGYERNYVSRDLSCCSHTPIERGPDQHQEIHAAFIHEEAGREEELQDCYEEEDTGGDNPGGGTWRYPG